MITKFRKKHILSFFDCYNKAGHPALDLFLNRYLRAHKAIGSNDRKVITEVIYGLVRHHGLVDLKQVESFLAHGEKPEQQSFPAPLFALLVNSLGEEKAKEFCKVSDGTAPITLRVNTLKTTREALTDGWKGRYDFSLCPHSSTGIVFHKKINFYILPEFLKGLFEIQDEGSQLLSQLVTVKPKDQILDYCAGAGGKSLAIAASMQNQGQIFLHDIRKNALISAQKRLKRAGIQNYQIIHDEPLKLKRLEGHMDWVFVDVPCSGSGTWRRNPDQKWKFCLKDLDNLIKEQREIFAKALPYLKPKGKIVYATCSIFPQENQMQIDHFLVQHNLVPLHPPLNIFPTQAGSDGFFGAVLVKNHAI